MNVEPHSGSHFMIEASFVIMITAAVMIMLVEQHSVVIIGPSMITAAVMIMLYDCRAAFRITLHD